MESFCKILRSQTVKSSAGVCWCSDTVEIIGMTVFHNRKLYKLQEPITHMLKEKHNKNNNSYLEFWIPGPELNKDSPVYMF